MLQGMLGNLLAGGSWVSQKQARDGNGAWCMVQHVLPPALPSRAEHSVLQLSPVLLGFPGQELLQA